MRLIVRQQAWSPRGRATLVAVLVVLGVGLFTLLPLVAGPESPREIVLVVRGMTFYLEGDTAPNPTIAVRVGEDLRFVLRNEEPGVLHNLAVKAWDVETPVLRGAGTASVRVRVPERAGRTDYRCTPHAQMMRGVIEVY